MERILKCIYCGLFFDCEQRVPMMIPTCGHSICKQCLQQKIETKENFLC